MGFQSPSPGRPGEKPFDSYLRPSQLLSDDGALLEQEVLRSEWNKYMGPSTKPVRYNKTSVLTLSFREEDDDLEVSREVWTPDHLVARY